MLLAVYTVCRMKHNRELGGLLSLLSSSSKIIEHFIHRMLRFYSLTVIVVAGIVVAVVVGVVPYY